MNNQFYYYFFPIDYRFYLYQEHPTILQYFYKTISHNEFAKLMQKEDTEAWISEGKIKQNGSL